MVVNNVLIQASQDIITNSLDLQDGIRCMMFAIDFLSSISIHLRFSISNIQDSIFNVLCSIVDTRNEVKHDANLFKMNNLKFKFICSSNTFYNVKISHTEIIVDLFVKT